MSCVRVSEVGAEEKKKFTRKVIRSRRTVWKLHRGAEIKDIFMYRYIYLYINVYRLRLEGIWANLAPSLWEWWGCSTQKVAQSWLAAQMILLWEFCENPNVTSSICPMKRSVLPNLPSPSRAGRRPTTSILQDPVATHGSWSSPSSWPPEAKTLSYAEARRSQINGALWWFRDGGGKFFAV